MEDLVLDCEEECNELTFIKCPEPHEVLYRYYLTFIPKQLHVVTNESNQKLNARLPDFLPWLEELFLKSFLASCFQEMEKGFALFRVRVYSADTTSFANEQMENAQVTKAVLSGGRGRRREERKKGGKGRKEERSKEKREGKG